MSNLANKLQAQIVKDLSSHEYHAMTDYVSNSMLSKLDKCPAALLVPQDDTDVFIEGRAAHSLCLEGMEVFLKEFVVAPSVDKRTKEGRATWADFQSANIGKDVISAELFEKLCQMRTAVNNHPFAHQLLLHGDSEQSVFWQDVSTGIWCKCRPDRIPAGGKGVLVDLKTTTDASERAFSRSCINYGYARQAAFYLDGVNAATGESYDAFAFVAVEKTEPFKVATYILDEEFIAWGRLEYQRLLNVYSNCKHDGKFPNYQSPDLVTLFKPGYL